MATKSDSAAGEPQAGGALARALRAAVACRVLRDRFGPFGLVAALVLGALALSACAVNPIPVPEDFDGAAADAGFAATDSLAGGGGAFDAQAGADDAASDSAAGDAAPPADVTPTVDGDGAGDALAPPDAATESDASAEAHAAQPPARSEV